MPATDESVEELITTYWKATADFNNTSVAGHTQESMRELLEEGPPMLRAMLGPDALQHAEYEKRTPIPEWDSLTGHEQRAFVTLVMMRLFPQMLAVCKEIRDAHLRGAN